MTAYICVACGSQFSESEAPPPRCPVCEDARQYVLAAGQQWTTTAALHARHRQIYKREEPGLLAIGVVPDFAINQRAYLIRHPAGNVLWDCVALLDGATVEIIEAFGGLRAIAISHPHYYSNMVEWARTFDCPIYLHEAEREWVMRPDPSIEYWSGDRFDLGHGFTLLRLGGHFAGGFVLHASHCADGAGALFVGDIIQVVQDRRWVSFMRSYPNLVPLAAGTIRRIVQRLGDAQFERVYGAFWGGVVKEDGRGAVERSAQRYIDMLEATELDGEPTRPLMDRA